jgi:hypothetical protein
MFRRNSKGIEVPTPVKACCSHSESVQAHVGAVLRHFHHLEAS